MRYTSSTQSSNIGGNRTFNNGTKIPIQTNRIWASKNDIIEWATSSSVTGSEGNLVDSNHNTAISGIILTVVADNIPSNNGQYILYYGQNGIEHLSTGNDIVIGDDKNLILRKLSVPQVYGTCADNSESLKIVLAQKNEISLTPRYLRWDDDPLLSVTANYIGISTVEPITNDIVIDGNNVTLGRNECVEYNGNIYLRTRGVNNPYILCSVERFNHIGEYLFTPTMLQDDFYLEQGAVVYVKFLNDCTADSDEHIKLNVNNTSDVDIIWNGEYVKGGFFKKDVVYQFIFNGEEYELIYSDSMIPIDGITAYSPKFRPIDRFTNKPFKILEQIDDHSEPIWIVKEYVKYKDRNGVESIYKWFGDNNVGVYRQFNGTIPDNQTLYTVYRNPLQNEFVGQYVVIGGDTSSSEQSSSSSAEYYTWVWIHDEQRYDYIEYDFSKETPNNILEVTEYGLYVNGNVNCGKY